MVGQELVKFLSSSYDSEPTWSYAQIIFSGGFVGQGVTVRMLQWLDGASWPSNYFWRSLDEFQYLTNLGPTF
jgi:hypothetical protein